MIVHKEEMTVSAYSYAKAKSSARIIDFFLGKNHCEESYRWHCIKQLYQKAIK